MPKHLQTYQSSSRASRPQDKSSSQSRHYRSRCRPPSCSTSTASNQRSRWLQSQWVWHYLHRPPICYLAWYPCGRSSRPRGNTRRRSLIIWNIFWSMLRWKASYVHFEFSTGGHRWRCTPGSNTAYDDWGHQWLQWASKWKDGPFSSW